MSWGALWPALLMAALNLAQAGYYAAAGRYWMAATLASYGVGCITLALAARE